MFEFRLGTGQATSHYLNQWWPGLLMHVCITRPQWVETLQFYFPMKWSKSLHFISVSCASCRFQCRSSGFKIFSWMSGKSWHLRINVRARQTLLTQGGPNKMDTNLQVTFSNKISWKKTMYLDSNFSLFQGMKSDNYSESVQVMAWHQPGNKLLPVTMMANVPDL